MAVDYHIEQPTKPKPTANLQDVMDYQQYMFTNFNQDNSFYKSLGSINSQDTSDV